MHTRHLFLLLLINISHGIDNENFNCYLNSYSAKFHQFSLDNLNKKFTIEKGYPYLGCTVRITLDYQLRIITLRFYATTTIGNDDIEYELRKYQIIIKVREISIKKYIIIKFFPISFPRI